MLNRIFNNNRTNTWPAFVDLFSNLVIILIFLLIVFIFLWTTTSVFNKRTGVRTIAELKQTNAEQSEKIRQMTADEAEAMRLLVQARANLENAETDINAQNLSMIDLITAYEAQVNKLQAEDDATKAQIIELREQLNAALVAAEEWAELEKQRRELQAEMSQRMENQTAEYKSLIASQAAEYESELKKLNAALAAAEESARTQETKYVEMSNRLNKALADKVAELNEMKQYQSEFYRAIKTALGGDTIGIESDGDRFIVSSDILFSTGSYKLSAEGKNQLRLISNVIKDFEAKIPSDVDWIIRIDGHTDTTPVIPGNRAYRNNMQLAMLRATAVMNELVRDGVSEKRLIPSGFGEMHPVSTGTDAASMQKNRRIELQLTNK